MARDGSVIDGHPVARRMRKPGRCGHDRSPLAAASGLLCLIAVLMLLPTPRVAAQPPPTVPGQELRMTLAEAVSHLDTGPAGAMARADLDRYLALQRRAFWAFLHDLDMNTAFGYAPTCVPDDKNPGLCVDPVDVYDPTAYRPTFDLRTEGTVLLYTFGKVSSARDQARAGVAASLHQSEMEKAKLVEQIKRAYYGILLGQALVDLVSDARSRLEQEMTRVEDRLRELKGSWEDEEIETDGDAEDEEVEKQELRQSELGGYLAEVRALQAQAQAGYNTALDGLRIAVGQPPGVKVLPSESELLPVLTELPPLAEMLDLAQRHNAMLLAAQAGVDAARAEAERTEADMWPSFVLRGGMRANLTAAPCLVDPAQPQICRDAQTSYPYAFLALNWNLDYPELITRHSEAKAKMAKMEAQRDGARMLVEAAVSAAYHEVRQRLQVLAAREDAEAWGRRLRTRVAARCGGLEVVDSGQERSDRCNEDKLADALRTWIVAKAGRLQATYELNMSVAQLSSALGQPLGLDRLPQAPPAGRAAAPTASPAAAAEPSAAPAPADAAGPDSAGAPPAAGAADFAP